MSNLFSDCLQNLQDYLTDSLKDDIFLVFDFKNHVADIEFIFLEEELYILVYILAWADKYRAPLKRRLPASQ
jgi:hypothetical protein